MRGVERHRVARRVVIARGLHTAAWMLAWGLPGPAGGRTPGAAEGQASGAAEGQASGAAEGRPPEGAAALAMSRFSSGRPGGPAPPPWREQALRGIRPNSYALVEDAGGLVLEIRSAASASSLLHPIAGELARARTLSWRWKTDGIASREAFGEKAGDDYSARVYLMFDYPLDRMPLGQRLMLRAARALHGEEVPAATLCYLLDPRAAAETLVDSPYTSRVRMIVVRSAARTGLWWREQRDLAADFQRAFGAEHGPGVPRLRAIAVAADTDQGGASLRTRFGDLDLR